jgi:phosphoenolpyruvate-protein phosphotransferase/dihydroxyacetone kinase phosphotransfer subunit
MVGLVIVSHSSALSRALVELVRQVAAEPIPICGVGGVGVDKKEFGTDACDIAAAIESVYSPAGVVVMMDLGSAILSAETALELVSEEMRPQIRLCGAPLVEGAVAAAVQISLGANLDRVCQEAARALAPKISQISEPPAKFAGSAMQGLDQSLPGEWQTIQLTVNTPHGLHARPAARFIQAAARFDARIEVKKLDSSAAPVPATSLNSIATLGVNRGDRIVVFARGDQAREALTAIKILVDDQLPRLAEEFAPAPPAGTAAPQGRQGMAAVSVSEGIAAGPLFHYRIAWPQISRRPAEDCVQEWNLLLQARGIAGRSILNRRLATATRLGETQAAIFEAHQLILEDPKLLDAARRRIFEENKNAALAWQESVQEITQNYRALSDEYLRQRAADVMDIGNQVLLNMVGQDAARTADLPHPVILVAERLSPTDTAALDTRKVIGLVTVEGGPTSHMAILARSLGIPAVAGAPPSILALPDNTSLALDGFSGTLWIQPGPQVGDYLKKRRARWLQRRRKLRKNIRRPAVTTDGRRLAVTANLGNVIEAQSAVDNGADGVGLLRTEFLYLTRSQPPSEAEQVDILRQIGRKLSAKPICVRTLDAGGDKPVAYLYLPAETNPNLGLRAVRLSLRHPELFRGQLRAILRTGADFDVRVMFPLISTSEEIDRILVMLEAVHRELVDENIAHRWPILTGIMVETPAAVLMMPALAKRLDFFSIGTNDLIQYSLAAERGNPNLADYADGLHPAILRQIKMVVVEAHRNAGHVAVCGELAADLAAVPALVGLGVDELSLTPPAIPQVKALLGRLAFNQTVDLAEKMMTMDRVADARNLAEAFLKKII